MWAHSNTGIQGTDCYHTHLSSVITFTYLPPHPLTMISKLQRLTYIAYPFIRQNEINFSPQDSLTGQQGYRMHHWGIAVWIPAGKIFVLRLRSPTELPSLTDIFLVKHTMNCKYPNWHWWEYTATTSKPNGDVCVLSGLTLENSTFWELSVYCAVKTESLNVF